MVLQMFSMGFKSGDKAGHFMMLAKCWCRKAWVEWAE
jgi:hypothetical protein